MNKPNEVENTPCKPIASEEQRGIRAAPLLFNAEALGAAVVACAIGGPKIPPWLGDFRVIRLSQLKAIDPNMLRRAIGTRTIVGVMLKQPYKQKATNESHQPKKGADIHPRITIGT